MCFVSCFNASLLPVFQKSQVSQDRGDSLSEWEKRLEKPSVPLMAKGPPGPPKIVEIEKKYSAIEGTEIKIYLNFDHFTIFFQSKRHAATCLSRATRLPPSSFSKELARSSRADATSSSAMVQSKCY